MITSVAAAILDVEDQEVDLAFSRDVLEGAGVMDADVGEGSRWLEALPSGAQTSVVRVSAAAFERRAGEGTFLPFVADDVAATVEHLRPRGACTSEVTREPWASYARLEAPAGHRLPFRERPHP